MSAIKDNKFELVHVSMLIRHGDRSPATNYNLQPPVQFECGMIDNDKKWIGLDDFTIQPVPPSAKLLHDKTKLFRGFQVQPCEIGQLTYRGFKQEYSIGSYMARRYRTLLDKGINNNSIYIQSTDYKRTIHSAAAFGLGFLPNQSTIRRSIPIHVSSPGNSLLTEPPPGIAKIYPYCDKLPQIRKHDLSSSNYQKELKKEGVPFENLVNILGIKKSQVPSITALYDHFFCRLCHNVSLPCGKAGCVNRSLAYQTAPTAHWSFSYKFTNSTSILAVQPFLFHTVISKINLAIKSISSNKQYHRFVLSFSHDTTLNPFLRSLGFSEFTNWPPYASRVVIELWRDTSYPSQAPESYYIRLLFNGASLMTKMAYPAKYFKAEGQLLSYATWKQALMSEKLRSVDYYKKICLAKQPKNIL